MSSFKAYVNVLSTMGGKNHKHPIIADVHT